MLLKDLMKEDMKPEHKQLFQMIWNIITQSIYPPTDHLTDEDMRNIFNGKAIRTKCGSIGSPFLGLHENMEAAPLKPYLTRTSYDLVFNLKQDAVNELYKKINFILGIAQRVAATRKRN